MAVARAGRRARVHGDPRSRVLVTIREHRPSRSGMRSHYDQAVPADRPIDRAAWAELIGELIRTETAGRKATFARLVGVDPKTISHWLAGTVDVAEASVRRVADALGRRPADMLIRVGYYRADEFAAAAEEPPERDEEVEAIMSARLSNSLKRELLQVLAEERLRDKQRRMEQMQRLIAAERRRTG